MVAQCVIKPKLAVNNGSLTGKKWLVDGETMVNEPLAND